VQTSAVNAGYFLIMDVNSAQNLKYDDAVVRCPRCEADAIVVRTMLDSAKAEEVRLCRDRRGRTGLPPRPKHAKPYAARECDCSRRSPDNDRSCSSIRRL
jgi:hypothetical protein